MIRKLRSMFVGLLATALVAGLAAPSLAQDAAADYPDRLITIYVGYGPGGASDVTARIIADNLFRDKGASVIVENKPGAGGRLAAEFVTKQPNDGYTLMVAGNSVISIARAIYSDLRYDPIDGLTPISIIAEFPSFILVVPPDHPARTFDELVAWTKAHPSEANYANPSPSYAIPTEQLKQSSGLDAQSINYRSGSEAITSVLSGETTFMLADPASSLPLIESGKLRALAVTSGERMDELPEVPTLEELGHKVNMQLWTGLFAAGDTPKPIVDKLQAEVQRIVAIPAVAEKLANMGLRPGGNTSDEYAALIAEEVAAYTATVEAAGLTFEQ